ncbi:nucleoside hydrolase-like domain-containing protein [Draconibacterium mangrovi]|uniref:nucleoside hydrolase-like domain-containing protein n=1 Tax=Draconibacterium mangrovi TaxID=2697469 RepID=UPI0013D3641F|nr:nucleoside hydrolase-like domain-containing protein [Draconibacterium mangrovi]
MKKYFAFLTSVLAALLFVSCGQKSFGLEDLAVKVDKSQQARILITTDLEVDDMNGVILSLMYADQYDIAGIVWTAGMWHFSGDHGLHTLGEITPNYRCVAQDCEHRVQTAADLTEYRPADPTWLDRMMDYYEADYQLMSKNNPNYPTPEYLRSITKVGNIEFEGDYRFETEGSNFIVDCIMDEDMRPLYIQHWGGINTTVRALYTIYEKYHGTSEWEQVLAKVTSKVRIGGSGEDNCRADSKIDDMFPGLQDGGYSMGGFFSYPSFFGASYNSEMRAPDELQPYLHADFILDAYKNGHGKLAEEIWLMGEGRAIFGEPIIYNYGLITYMDWAKAGELGWSTSRPGFARADFKPFDWSVCQFGCASFINIGLRSDVTNRITRGFFGPTHEEAKESNRYTIVMWEELAARADWAINKPEDCNHAPIVTAEKLDFVATPGQTVSLSGKAIDPDGDRLVEKWWVPDFSCTYKDGKAEGLAVSSETGWSTEFTIPADAKVGDKFVVNLEVRDNATRPMTRFAQYVITVS